MEPYRVFVSSVLSRTKEDLSAERDAARAAVEYFRPITTAWAFEEEPASTKRLEDSYLDEVKTCDLLVLVIGCVLTAPTRAEYNTALDFGKEVLVFCKDVESREPETEEFLSSLDLKYESFMNAVELREKVRKALGLEILGRIRGEPGGQSERGERLTHLRRFARNRDTVRVAPMTPQCEYDEFIVLSIQNTAVALKKHSSGEEITIPTQRVADVLCFDPQTPPVLQLDGRLQWLTLLERWRFFGESPDNRDGFRIGVPKETSIGDPQVGKLAQDFERRGLKLSWSRQDRLAEQLATRTHQVFYDDEGYYLRSSGSDSNLILVVSSQL